MEQDDEEFEKLLGEIPRATSAPPHFEELQKVMLDDGDTLLNAKDGVGAVGAPQPATDELLHCLYSRPFPADQMVPQSVDNLPASTTFYNRLSPDSTGTSPFRLRQIELPHNLEAQCHPPHAASSQQALTGDPVAKLSPEHVYHSEQPVPASFVNMKLHDDTTGRPETSAHMENGDGDYVLQRVLGCSSHSGLDSVIASSICSDLISGVGFSSASDMSMAPCLSKNPPPLDPFCHNTLSPAGQSVVESGFHCGLGEPLNAKLAISATPVQQTSNMVCNGYSLMNPIGANSNGYALTMLPLQRQQQSNLNYGPIDPAMSGQAVFQCPDTNGLYMLPSVVNKQAHFISNMESASSVLTQQMREAATVHVQQQMEDRARYRQRLQQQFLLRQQHLQEQQARFHACLQGQPGAVGTGFSKLHSRTQTGAMPSISSSLPFDVIQQPHTSRPTLLKDLASMDNWKPGQQSDGIWAAPVVVLPEASAASSVCRYFAQGFCSRGEACPFPHPGSHRALNILPVSGRINGIHQSSSFSQKVSSHKSPRDTQAPSPVVMIGSNKKDHIPNGHSNGHALSNGFHLPASRLNAMNGTEKGSLGSSTWKELEALHMLDVQQQQQQPPKYASLDEVEGRIYAIAKDQHGCRFLQRKCEEGASEEVQKIFVEIIDQIVELMTDPFGNYLVQKLLEVCTESQRMEILYRVTGKDQLVIISLNMHGTRAVQKLIETLNSSEHVTMVISSLRQGVVTLIKDLNGNHVVQRCLQHLSSNDSQFIFDAAASHCVEIATHRHGCCVLQRCVDFSSGKQRERLVAEIAANALILSQDPFGNYVVQYILDLDLEWATMEVIARLDGSYGHLSTQKFSSNVVEKCLKLAGEESRTHIIRELMSSTRLAQLLQDPYANYVIQSALSVAKGTLHTGLVEAIRPHLPALRSSPFGKRILSRTNLKK